MTQRIHDPDLMTVGEWLTLTGEHRLAFDRALSVQVPRKKHKPEHPQRWRGGDLYNYGDVPPRYPMPAIRRQWWNGDDTNGYLYYSTNGLFEWLPN